MSPKAPSASLFLALDFILHGPQRSANSGIILLDYGVTETFEELWVKGLEGETASIRTHRAGNSPEDQDGTTMCLDWANPDQQVLIIGNDPPEGVFDGLPDALKGINFRDHFTATSWLAAWKVKFSPTDKEKKEKLALEGMVKIAVIDPREARFAQGAARGLKTIFRSASPMSKPPSPAMMVPRTGTLGTTRMLPCDHSFPAPLCSMHRI